jgi:hypothetical protein
MFAGSDPHALFGDFEAENESHQVRNVGFFIDSFVLRSFAILT